MSGHRIEEQVLALVAQPPASTCRESPSPREASDALIQATATKAALAASAYALPPGPLAWLSIAPEMLTVWRIQKQLIADIAALHGASPVLGPSQMLWCLFRHTAAQAVRDLAVRVGERWVVQPAARVALQQAAAALGAQVGRQWMGQAFGRWVPVLGALGVGAYAYYDTRQVGLAALELFEHDAVIEV